MSEIKVGDLLTLENGKYTVLSILEYEKNKYIFTNRIDNYENSTSDFFVFKVLDSGLIRVNDQNIIKILLPNFMEKIKDLVATQVKGG